MITKSFLIAMSTLLLTACPDSNRTNAQQKPAAPTAAKPTPPTPTDSVAAKPADKDAVIITSIINNSEAYYKELCKDASVSKEERRSKLILHIARKFLGTPYVAKTLETEGKERLVINARQLDCTTYVENTMAIYLCVSNGQTSYDDYKNQLRLLRYANGEVTYAARQHYFTQWIEENTKKGYVHELQSPTPPFTAEQLLRIDFMTTHVSLYPMLKDSPEDIKTIAQRERELSGRRYRYIPKTSIRNNSLFRSTIKDGDIIAITTSKKGLDTSHIGIAVWHKDGLHMLNASQIHKKVVEEPMTLYQYMQRHPSQTGIRIIRMK